MSVPCSVVMKGRRAAGGHLLREQARKSNAEWRSGRAADRALALGNLRHARGQSEAVRRIVEQRVVRDFDFVIVDARHVGIETDGIGVADEVDLVAAVRQFEAELGGDDAAAAVGGVAGDADAHAPSMG